jgi:hypothetical protein
MPETLSGEGAAARAPKKPSPLLAGALGIACPGAGLVYAGRPRAGVAIAALFVATAVLVPLIVVETGVDLAKLPGLVRAAAVALWGPSAVFGVLAALLAPPAPRRPWQHPWWILGVVVIAWASRFALRERVVDAHLATVAVPSEAQLRAVAPPGADTSGVYVVLKRRVAPADLVPGAWVLVGDGDGPDRAGRGVARITSTESGLELDDGRRVSAAAIVGVGVLAR